MKATVLEVIKENSEVRTLKLNLEQEITFEPGQFITIIYNIENKLVRRAYSISHWAEQPTKTITISLNQAPNGTISPKLYNVKVNDVLELEGAFGVFKLNKSNNPALFLAAGTGVTPLNTMIESEEKRDLTLIYSVRSEDLILFNETLNKQSNLKFIPTVTDNIPESWTGKTGRINKELIENNLKENTEIYICGMQEFVRAMITILESLNVQKERIHTERW
jgi:ferredoxin-NADP reductase